MAYRLHGRYSLGAAVLRRAQGPLSVIECVDGNLRGIKNVFERAGGNRALTMQRDDSISLRMVSMADENVTARLPDTNEPEPLQFLQKLPRRQMGQWRHRLN